MGSIHDSDPAFAALLREAASTPDRAVLGPLTQDFGPRYAVERLLGEGGMGRVYGARDLDRDRPVALKTLRFLTGEGLYRFKHEFRALTRVVHPNLVPLYALGSHAGTWFFSMEWVQGVEPRVWVAAQPEREPALRVVFRQIALGLQALHDAGLVHRDLKPSNVIVGWDGAAKILDFGLVALRGAVPVGDTHTEHVVGTPRYMAPEAHAGGTLSPAADWYAVGVMLAELLGDADAPALSALAEALQHPDAGARPSGAAVLAALGEAPVAVAQPAEPAPFVGRAAELGLLAEHW